MILIFCLQKRDYDEYITLQIAVNGCTDHHQLRAPLVSEEMMKTTCGFKANVAQDWRDFLLVNFCLDVKPMGSSLTFWVNKGL